jgi:catechol 2,3-dioxygenase
MINPLEASLDEQVDVHQPIAFTPRRVGHMNIFVSELARSMSFYETICGLESVGRSDRMGCGFVSNGNTHHDVGCIVTTEKGRIAKDGHVQVPKSRGHRPGLNHVGWEMQSEWHLVAAYHRAVLAGLKIHRIVDHTISRSVYVFDPDGQLHEIYADTTPAWREVFATEGLDGLTTGWAPGKDEPSRAENFDPNPQLRSVPGAFFNAARLTGFTLSVRNFPRMRKFYTEVLGLKPTFESVSPRVVCLSGGAGGHDLVLVERNPDEIGGLHHFSFEVPDPDSLDRGEQRYRAEEGKVELSLDLPHKRSVVIQDPDGMTVELYSPKGGELAADAFAGEANRAYMY